jgi:hypothetical protein
MDIPVLMRLFDKAMVLNNVLEYTRESLGSNGAMLSEVLLPSRGLHTLVTRINKGYAVGQYRLRPDNQHAQIVFLAPSIPVGGDDTVLLHALDGMAREAGKHEARALVAEVDERSPLFETMRTAGYAVYARQEVWGRLPEDAPIVSDPVEFDAETEVDEHDIRRLIAQIVPSLIQQVTAPPANCAGWVYRQDNKVAAYVAVADGKLGMYLLPYIHPEYLSDAGHILNSLIKTLQYSRKRPVYVCVRRPQEWLTSMLAEERFDLAVSQAVMVKYMTTGVQQSTVKSAQQKVSTATVPVKPPAQSVETDNLG